MTTDHTPGKLTLHTHGRITAGPAHEFTNGSAQEQFAMVTGLTRSPNPTAERDANARRLAACWNACIDLPTDALEDMTAAGITLHQKISQLGQSEVEHFERADRLRALLHRVTQDSEWSCMDPDLQDDIAKALGMDKTPALPVPPPPPDIFEQKYCEPMCANEDQQPQPGGGPGYICRKCGFDLPF